MTILITGGCGFIGSNFITSWLPDNTEEIWNVDNLTYASNRAYASDKPLYNFIKGDIRDTDLLKDIIKTIQPRAIINFAAETHVDNSINSPRLFVDTNINGTYGLLEASLAYWRSLSSSQRKTFRLINISTDEVYGSLKKDQASFTEKSSINPNSPYSASKASADSLARAFFKTYGLPIITTRCSNNFGPFQHKEKLIPTVVHSILSGEKIPIYGNGQQIRDWIYVQDHIAAVRALLRCGLPGHTYNIGGNNELQNIVLIQLICNYFELKYDSPKGGLFNKLAHFVDDRPGHDLRYSVSCQKIRKEIGWSSKYDFGKALGSTIDSLAAAFTSDNASNFGLAS